MSNCKPGKKYPHKIKRKMCYTSPTSGRIVCGNPILHCNKEKNKEFTMVRAIGGGVKRLYNWKRHYKPAY